MNMEKIIVCAISSLFQALSVVIILFSLLPGKRKTDKVKLFFIMWIYFIFVFIFIPNQLRFILFIIVISLIMYFILNIKDKKLVLYSFITIMIVTICEMIILLLSVIINFNVSKIAINLKYSLIINVTISVLSILFINIKCIKKLLNKIMILFSNNKVLINYLYLFLIIIYILVLKNGMELIFKSNYYINLIFMIGICIIVGVVMRNELKSEQLQEINKQMLNYVTKYEKIITEKGKANHEFKNQLMVIKGYAQMGNDGSNKLNEYLDTIIEDSRKTQSSYLISQLNKFPAGGLKGLIYYKLSLIEDEKIKYEIDVETGVKAKLNSLNTNTHKNITKIMGVLLDNAIDASKKSKGKKILLSVTKDKNSVIFNISNTYKGKINIDKIGTGYTTKGSGHGYGLRLVNDIIEINNNFNINNEIDGEYYITKLIVKTNLKKDKK